MEADTQQKKASSKSKSASSKTTIKQKGKSKTTSQPAKSSSTTGTNKGLKTASSKTSSTSKSKTSARGGKTDSASKPTAPAKAKLMQKDTNQSLQKTADSISMDQRHQLIATTAYLRAEQRGFSGGDPMEDWLIAESEVDASLSGKTKAKSRTSKTTRTHTTN